MSRALPRERAFVSAPSSCPACGGSWLSKLGEDLTETLEVIPRTWKVIQTVREKFACRDCRVASHKYVTACLTGNVTCRHMISALMGFGLRGAFGVVQPEAHKLRPAFLLPTRVNSDVRKAGRERAFLLR